MDRLWKWLIVAGVAVAITFTVDRLTDLDFSLLSALAEAVTVGGIVALAIEYGIYVTELRPQARAREAVVNLADSNAGKWAPAREELLELGGAAIDALRPLALMRGGARADRNQIRAVASRALSTLCEMAIAVENEANALAAVQVLGRAAQWNKAALGRLQRILYRAEGVPPQLAVQAAVALGEAAAASPEHLGNTFNSDRGKIAGVFALCGLVIWSRRLNDGTSHVDVREQLEKANGYPDEDVSDITAFIVSQDDPNMNLEKLCSAMTTGELSLSPQGTEAVRRAAKAANEFEEKSET